MWSCCTDRMLKSWDLFILFSISAGCFGDWYGVVADVLKEIAIFFCLKMLFYSKFWKANGKFGEPQL